jgi:hypothetical protein
LMCYALLAVPAVGVGFWLLAKELLAAIDARMVKTAGAIVGPSLPAAQSHACRPPQVFRMNIVHEAFQRFDADQSGRMSLQELHGALEQLSIHRSHAELRSLVKRLDDGSGELGLAPFRALLAQMNLPAGRPARALLMVKGSVVAVLGWTLLGGVLFSTAVEQDWSFVDALYFCVSSLTTLGLGDLAPTSTESCVLSYLYNFVGLGWMATLLSAIARFLDARAQASHLKSLSSDWEHDSLRSMSKVAALGS